MFIMTKELKMEKKNQILKWHFKTKCLLYFRCVCVYILAYKYTLAYTNMHIQMCELKLITY